MAQVPLIRSRHQVSARSPSPLISYGTRVKPCSAKWWSKVKTRLVTPPVEVMITTSERTALDYLLSPISESFARAFREQ